MREFSFSIMDHLNAGLRRSKRNVFDDQRQGSMKNRPGLVKALNVQISERGLEPYRPVIIPFSQDLLNAEGIQLEWPMPQLFKGKGVTILATKRRVFYVNEEDWSLYELTDFFDSHSLSSAKASIQLGNQWQFVDFWDTWFLHNGVTTLMHTGRSKLIGEPDRIFISNDVRVQAGCGHLGRAWMGGFDPEYFYSDTFKSVIEGIADNTTSDVIIKLRDLEENWVWWSSIGGGDAILPLFHSNLSWFSLVGTGGTGYTQSRPFILDMLRRNEQGSMPMPWQGKVRHMKPLGNFIMVYGDGGVSALKPSGSVVGLIELPQFSQGISNTGAVGGDLNEHVFLDNSGVLWRIESSLSVEKLDFREFMAPLLGTDIIISFSARERRWYICNGVKAFTLFDGRLTEHNQQITSVIETEGAELGMGSTLNGDGFEILTDTINMALVGLKTLTSIDVASEIPNPTVGQGSRLKVGCDLRYENRKDFVSSRDVPLNHFGQARVGVTAADFRIRIKGDDFRDFNIDDVVLKYQVSDKRFIRGPGIKSPFQLEFRGDIKE